ncbi:MAG: tetratricopeptide repeat protein [Verrucomicrobia bacterium]|nr:tetratricopeptide repeat protein [Verrucomicrobiota bacterium]
MFSTLLRDLSPFRLSGSALAGAAARLAAALLLLGGGVATCWYGNNYTPLFGPASPTLKLVWIPQHGLLPEMFYGVSALLLGALLLLGLWARPALHGAMALLSLIWLEHLRLNALYEVSRHLVPLAALLLVSQLADPTGLRLGLDALRRSARPDDDPARRNSAAVLFLRFLLGSLFLLQSMRTLGSGLIPFVERNYIQLFAATGMPTPLLWAAGLANPCFQLSGSLLLLTGWRTKLGALLHAVFLLQIVFGHMIGDPLEYEGDLQKFGLSNLFLAIAILALVDRGDAYSWQEWRARRGAASAALGGVGRIARGLLLAGALLLGCAGPIRAASVDELVAEADRRRQTGELADAWESVRLYRAALRQDPRAVAAWVGLAQAYSSPPISYSGNGRRLRGAEPYLRSVAAARQALRIDPKSPAARLILAQAKLYWDYDWTAAERMLRDLRETAPELIEARLDYARLLGSRQRFDAAYAELAEIRRLAPASAQAWYVESIVLYFQRRYEECARLVREARERFPGQRISHFLLGLALIETGALPEAIQELEKFAELSERNPGGIATLACAYARAGRPADARAILRELDRRAGYDAIVYYQYATVLAELGETRGALTWLERAVREERANWPLFLRQDPRLDVLRTSDRFHRLQQRLFPARQVSR